MSREVFQDGHPLYSCVILIQWYHSQEKLRIKWVNANRLSSSRAANCVWNPVPVSSGNAAFCGEWTGFIAAGSQSHIASCLECTEFDAQGNSQLRGNLQIWPSFEWIRIGVPWQLRLPFAPFRGKLQRIVCFLQRKQLNIQFSVYPIYSIWRNER